jgi:hypothetical protein
MRDKKLSGILRTGFKSVVLEDGVVSHDCLSCGHSDLDIERAVRHQHSHATCKPRAKQALRDANYDRRITMAQG